MWGKGIKRGKWGWYIVIIQNKIQKKTRFLCWAKGIKRVENGGSKYKLFAIRIQNNNPIPLIKGKGYKIGGKMRAANRTYLEFLKIRRITLPFQRWAKMRVVELLGNKWGWKKSQNLVSLEV